MKININVDIDEEYIKGKRDKLNKNLLVVKDKGLKYLKMALNLYIMWTMISLIMLFSGISRVNSYMKSEKYEPLRISRKDMLYPYEISKFLDRQAFGKYDDLRRFMVNDRIKSWGREYSIEDSDKIYSLFDSGYKKRRAESKKRSREMFKGRL